MTWINIQQAENNSEKNIIFMPSFLSDGLSSNVQLSFGQRRIKAIVKTTTSQSIEVNDYSNPMQIYLSANLLNELLVQTEITYQLKIHDNECTIGPIIGLHLGEQQYYYHNRHMKQYIDSMHDYQSIGGLIIAFKDGSIDETENCVYGLYYHDRKKQWRYGKFPLPSVIFRRAYKTTQDLADRLYKKTNGNLFNSISLTKWDVYLKIREYQTFKEFLPETAKVINGQDVKKFLRKHSEIILKPADLSRARGICIIKTVSTETFLLFDYSNGVLLKTIVDNIKLQEFLRSGNFLNGNYIAQPYINLAKINNSPWDIRVVMQKNRKKQWQCNGIECRLAGKEHLITNISRGGSALSIREATSLSFGEQFTTVIKAKVKDAAFEFCRIMEQTNEHFAEFGLDLAFDTNQKLWFIEANTRPSFKGFKTMDLNNYYHISTAPIHYAASLAGF
ncbi:YheC/YheD family protein [Oceanobacillus zhaokaii]|nr:YheC/YheD family protein [Oceanobacillus zhaokaii]